MSATTMEKQAGAVREARAPLLDVQGMSISFATAGGRLEATRDVTFSVAQGERIGVVGESGCGKTVTGLSLLRLLPEDVAHISGKLDFMGVDLATCSEAQLREIRGQRIGMIFQEPMTALNPLFTVGLSLIHI